MSFDGNRCDIVTIERDSFERPTEFTFAKEPWSLSGRKRNFEAVNLAIRTKWQRLKAHKDSRNHMFRQSAF